MPTTLPLFYTFHFYLFGADRASRRRSLFVTRKSPVAAALWLVNVMFCARRALRDARRAVHRRRSRCSCTPARSWWCSCSSSCCSTSGTRASCATCAGSGGRLAAGVRRRSRCSPQVMALARAQTPADRCTLPHGSAASRSRATGRDRRRSPGRCSREYLLAFEMTSVLLLVAIVGAVVLGKRRTPHDR